MRSSEREQIFEQLETVLHYLYFYTHSMTNLGAFRFSGIIYGSDAIYEKLYRRVLQLVLVTEYKDIKNS